MGRWLHGSPMANAAQVAGVFLLVGLAAIGFGVGLWTGHHYPLANFMYGIGALFIALGIAWFFGAGILLAKTVEADAPVRRLGTLSHEAEQFFVQHEKAFRQGRQNFGLGRELAEELRLAGYLRVETVQPEPWPGGQSKGFIDFYWLTPEGSDKLSALVAAKHIEIIGQFMQEGREIRSQIGATPDQLDGKLDVMARAWETKVFDWLKANRQEYAERFLIEMPDSQQPWAPGACYDVANWLNTLDRRLRRLDDFLQQFRNRKP